MNLNKFRYVPCIRWKQGEYKAMLHLGNSTKDIILPLIEVSEIGFDFENGQEIKSLDEHIKLFTKRLISKWGTRPCLIDTKLIEIDRKTEDGNHPITFIFEQLRANGCMAIPVTDMNRNLEYHKCIKNIVDVDKKGLSIRISIEDIVNNELKKIIDDFLKILKISPTDCDIIIDLDAPNFEPIDGFSKLIMNAIKNLPYLSDWRTIILIGTSFPSSMSEVKLGVNVIPRYEWLLYKILVRQFSLSNIRLPIFGDYLINHPDLLQVDMRIIKPSASIRYTIKDNWIIIKGPNIRDNGTKQFMDHCKTLVKSGYFYGSDYSTGDGYIAGCAIGEKSTGNLTTWRWVGTNHHVEVVAKDVSNLFDSIKHS